MELGANEDDLPQRALCGCTVALLGILIKDNNASRIVVLSALSDETSSAILRTLVYHCRVSLDQGCNIMTRQVISTSATCVVASSSSKSAKFCSMAAV